MYKEKLKDLLCEIPEIKEQIMELKIGYIIKYNKIQYQYIPTYKDDNYKKFTAIQGENDMIETHYEFNKDDIEGIYYAGVKVHEIGNPLEERFLRMYLGYNYVISNSYNGYLFIKEQNIKQKKDEFDLKNFDIQLDNTKSFSNQTEKVYQEIYEFLIDNK